MTGQVQAQWGGAAAAAAVVGLGVYFAVAGWDAAQRWATVLGLFVGLAGLWVAVAGLRRGRREAAAGGQGVVGSSVGGGVTQVHGTCGNVRIRHAGEPGAASGTPLPPGPASSSGSGQTISGSAVGGPVDQVRETGGDVDIEQGP
ncbi:hypothetical protein Q3V23_19620 [Streptomyces sp. VNUA116]|uniref:hypothetical protein n=1 Tax=Streptomyces sp. VNUA116 TaxID=3062449 RepID=UPI00267485FF|nr:hypothetical protein [Streptomyces sp. VNUA116]WKU46093.1 hypothetical protein Q3V23_19620 [Streptomyces sp. VNUA116]